MSAIYGIINKNGSPVTVEMLQQVKLALKHRAVDGAGEMTSDNAAFGWCGLNIHPNQENEQLPLADGDLVFTANAQLHNRDELVHKLGLDAKQYAATPDSYLLLSAYKKWKESCVHHLEGEYVYAIWNKASKQLFISTDHIGYKSLYYYDTPEQFIFCSEIKGIEAIKKTQNYFDFNAVTRYLFLLGDPASTYNKEIRYLTGGNWLTCSNKEIRIERYWNLKPTGKYHFKKDEDWYEQLRELYSGAIYKRLNPAATIAITLSGGLDSGSMATILARYLKSKNKPLYTISSVLPADHQQQYVDERIYINEVLKQNDNIIPAFCDPGNEGPYDGICEAISRDEVIPFYFHYMDKVILEKAKSLGIKTIYTGYGGDYWVSAQGNQVLYRLLKQGKIVQSLKLFSEVNHQSKYNILSLFRQEYFSHTMVSKILWEEKWNFKGHVKREILDSIQYKGLAYPIYTIPALINDGAIGRNMGFFENRHEWYGMSAATPFFDLKLMEFMSDVPLRLYRAGGQKRSLFRNAMKDVLPELTRNRPDKNAFVPDSRMRIERDTRFSFESFDHSLLSKIFDLKKLSAFYRSSISMPATVTKAQLNHICQIASLDIVMRHFREKNYFFSD